MNSCTRDTGSQGDKCNGIDSIFEVDEAAKVSGDIADDRSAKTDASDGNHKGGVAIGNPLKYDINQFGPLCVSTVSILSIPFL